ncbi:MAG: type IV pilus twitching motility protein PilT, partial [Microcystis aeruginosa]
MSQNFNSSSRSLQPLPVPSIPIPPSELIKGTTPEINQEMSQKVATKAKQVPNMPQNGQNSPSRPPHSRASNQPTLEYLIQFAFDRGYSDVHLGVGEQPRMRDRGEMIILNYPEIDINTFYSWLREILGEEEILRFKKDLEFDGATQYEFARARINIFESLRGPGMVLRLIPMKIPTMEQLRLPMVFRDVCDVQKGLILITGPTGSGKSTTLAAMIDYINKEHPKHIITIEDPIEFVHKSRRSLIKQREVGIHTHEFDNARKACLREDPDI